MTTDITSQYPGLPSRRKRLVHASCRGRSHARVTLRRDGESNPIDPLPIPPRFRAPPRYPPPGGRLVRVAIVFPGQGTQSPGMGAPWREHPAWKIVEQAEGALGEPLAPLLLDAPAEQLARTRNAQLAVLCTSLVAWEAARPMLDNVVAFAGHSLGQVTALIASGALDLDDGVRFAARRAELTQAAADAHPGRMAALLGATIEQAEAACAAAPDGAWIANDNAPGQVVVAGTPDGVERALARAKEIGVRRATTLNVGGAFHTPLMYPARDGLRTTLPDVS